MTDELAPIEVVIDVDATPDEVWGALTTPAELAVWWAAGDISAEVGHRFTLDMGPFGVQPCEVLESEPACHLRFRFTDDWELDWRLDAVGDGTRVTMVHSGFDATNPRDVFAHANMAIGWRDTVLPGLREHLVRD